MLITSWAFQNLPVGIKPGSVPASHLKTTLDWRVIELSKSQFRTWRPMLPSHLQNRSPDRETNVNMKFLCETTSQIQPVTFVAPVCKQQKASHVITRRNCEHSTWCLLLAIARNTTMMNSERSQFMAFWVPVDLCQAQRLMTFPSLTWNCSNPPDSKKTRKDLPSGYLT